MKFTNAIALALCLAPVFAQNAAAQAAQPCLVLNNAWYTPTQNKVISIEINGYSGYWSQIYNTTQLVEGPDKYLVRAANFTINLYEGGEGSHGGALLETTTSGGPSKFVLWTYIKPSDSFFTERHFLECVETGAWLALVHG